MSWSDAWEIFRYAILAALVAGVVCPVVGCMLLVRRTGFYGITLPQFAACGMAFGYAVLPWWIENVGLGGLDLESALLSPHALRNYQIAWAMVFTFGGLVVLTLLGGDKGTETGRVAAAFAIAASATILLAQSSPIGKENIESLLRGEILTLDLHELETIVVVYVVVLLIFAWCHRALLIASFDPETARVLGMAVGRYEMILTLLVGLTVATGVLIVGPVVLFGLLVIPPLAARGLAWSMGSFYVIAALLGGAAALGGLMASFTLDLPLGPALCAVAAVEMIPCWVIARLRG